MESNVDEIQIEFTDKMGKVQFKDSKIDSFLGWYKKVGNWKADTSADIKNLVPPTMSVYLTFYCTSQEMKEWRKRLDWDWMLHGKKRKYKFVEYCMEFSNFPEHWNFYLESYIPYLSINICNVI